MNTQLLASEQEAHEIDSVMAEVHRVKFELSARFNHDISAMVRDARARQAASGHKVVDRSLRVMEDSA